MGNKILVIDDDKEVTLLLKAQLERGNYRVVGASSGREGLQKAFHERPDLIILDLMMPEMDGWEVCRRLRELSDVPIIMLTARSMRGDAATALEGGADDYLNKPFSDAELQARIKAVLRRTKIGQGNGTPRVPAYSNGDLTIDFERRRVTVRGETVDLTPIEFKVLTVLVHNAGRVLPHSYILNQVWGAEYAYDINYVKLYIRYLRSKIEAQPSNPVYIQTEWGEGYRFCGA